MCLRLAPEFELQSPGISEYTSKAAFNSKQTFQNKHLSQFVFLTNSLDLIVGMPHIGSTLQIFAEGGFYFGQTRGAVARGKGVAFWNREGVLIQGDWIDGQLEGFASISTSPFKVQRIGLYIHNVLQYYTPAEETPQESRSYLSGQSRLQDQSLFDQTLEYLVGSARRARNTGKNLVDSQSGSVRHGVVNIYKADGSRFHGLFEGGIMKGLGGCIDVSGNTQIGWFEDGRVQGLGSCNVEADRYVGLLDKGRYDGPGAYYSEADQVWRCGLFEQGDFKKTLCIETGTSTFEIVPMIADSLVKYIGLQLKSLNVDEKDSTFLLQSILISRPLQHKVLD